MTTNKKNYKLIQSLARAFTIINCFSKDESQLTLNEISQKTDLNINTPRGLVQTLLHYHYLAYDEAANTYRLGLVFMEKARIAQFEFNNRLINLVRSDLQQLADTFSVSTRMMSIEGTQAPIVIEAKPSQARYSLVVHESTEFPLYATATGKLILANLDSDYRDQVIDQFEWKEFGPNNHTNKESLLKDLAQIKDRELSVENQELGLGFSSLAVPVFLEGALIYSLSLTTTDEILKAKQDQMLEGLKQIKDKLNQVLASLAWDFLEWALYNAPFPFT